MDMDNQQATVLHLKQAGERWERLDQESPTPEYQHNYARFLVTCVDPEFAAASTAVSFAQRATGEQSRAMRTTSVRWALPTFAPATSMPPPRSWPRQRNTARPPPASTSYSSR